MLDEKRRAVLSADYEQGFPAFCGLTVSDMDVGFFEAELQVRPEHLQQNGFVHAGLIATMADHTAGYSAYTHVGEDITILTIEFKINFFKPAVGDRIICRSRVLNGGRKVIVSESDVFVVAKGREKKVSKATVTMMPVPTKDLG